MSQATEKTVQAILNSNCDDTGRLAVGIANWANGSWVAVDFNPLSAFNISDKDDDATPNYYGFTKPDGSWYILKETVSAGNDSYRYEYGLSAYPWANRATQTYHNLSAVF